VGKDISWESRGFMENRQFLEVKCRLNTYDFAIPLLGQYQLSNAATSIAALEVLMEKGARIPRHAIVSGMRDVKWEGRLQVLNRHPLIVVDGAHNQDSTQKLRLALERHFKFEQGVLVIGMSSDKDLTGIVTELAPVFKKVIVTRSTHPRAMATAPIAAEFNKHGITAQETDDVAKALTLALTLAGKNDMICVTGSLFVAAAAIEQAKILGLKP
jgi:dihydrofolate synthase/folylpolyglutamate synthase